MIPPASSSTPLSEYVTLISNDGFEFVVLREAACVAGTIRKMLDPNSMFVYLVLGLGFVGFLWASGGGEGGLGLNWGWLGGVRDGGREWGLGEEEG